MAKLGDGQTIHSRALFCNTVINESEPALKINHGVASNTLDGFEGRGTQMPQSGSTTEVVSRDLAL